MQELMAILDSCSPPITNLDRLKWKYNSNVEFTIKSFTIASNTYTFPAVLTKEIADFIWMRRAQLNVSLLAQRKFKTSHHLLRLNIILPEDAMCSLCLNEIETT